MSIDDAIGSKFRLSLIVLALLVAGCSTRVEQVQVYPVYKITGETESQLVDNSYYQQGKDYFVKGMYGSALSSFQIVLGQNSHSILALNGIAACYDKWGRFQVAMRYYHRALQIDPESTMTLNNLGYSLALQGRTGRADTVFDLALKKDPGNEYAHANKRILSRGVVPVVEERAAVVAEMVILKPERDKEGKDEVVFPTYQVVTSTPDIASRQKGSDTSDPDVRRVPVKVRVALDAVESGRTFLYGPTKRGDNIWNISLRLSREQSIDHQKMLVALAKSNPEVFIKGDINLLNTGFMLWVPSVDEIAAMRVYGQEAADAALADYTVEVSNGNGRRGSAHMMAIYLEEQGARISRINDAKRHDIPQSILYFRSDRLADAQGLAERLPVPVRLEEQSGGESSPWIRLILGKDMLEHEGAVRKALLYGSEQV